MRKIRFFVGLMIAASFVLTACTCIELNRLVLDRDTLTIAVGDTERLSAIAYGNISGKNLTWKSNHEDIATVDGNGLITAIAEGTTIITVTTACGNYQATAELEVITIPVTSIRLNRHTLTFNVGGSERLTATVNPSNATIRTFSWATDDASIATVDNTGLVTAQRVGRTNITVTTACGKTDVCVVTVNPIFLTGIALNKSSLELHVGEQETLIVIFTPHNATNQEVTWKSNDETVAIVDENGRVTAISEGPAIITATAAENGRTASASISVYYIPEYGVVINGIRWATRNVASFGFFALTSECSGMFYQWGRREGWSSEFPGFGVPVPGWNPDYVGGWVWNIDDDPCPEGWRIPTRDQFELLIEAGSSWTTQRGVWGRRFGTPPNTIFLPAAGWRHFNHGILDNVNLTGNYWSRSGADSSSAIEFHFTNQETITGGWQRHSGLNIRCIKNEP